MTVATKKTAKKPTPAPKPSSTSLGEIDFLQDAFGSSASKIPSTPAQKPSLDALTKEAKRMVELAAKIKEVEETLTGLKDSYRVLEQEVLPEMMDTLEMQNFQLTNGNSIEITPFISANIPSATAIEKAQDEERAELEARRDEAFKWLRAHKYDSLIKNTVTCTLAKGQEKLAALLMAFAKKQNLTAVRQSNVHPSTLASFVKEQLKKGSNIPFETFNIQTGNRAVLKENKER